MQVFIVKHDDQIIAVGSSSEKANDAIDIHQIENPEARWSYSISVFTVDVWEQAR
jgi:hypothetical protein